VLVSLDRCFGKVLDFPFIRIAHTPSHSEGAEGFLTTQYGAIGNISLLVAVGIFLSYFMRPDQQVQHGVGRLSSSTLGVTAVLTFALGAASSAASGWVSMALSAQANIRVTSMCTYLFVVACRFVLFAGFVL
jgi:Na+/H+-translocating membrane pyrophosphatase